MPSIGLVPTSQMVRGYTDKTGAQYCILSVMVNGSVQELTQTQVNL